MKAIQFPYPSKETPGPHSCTSRKPEKSGIRGSVTLATFSVQTFLWTAVNLDEPASSLPMTYSNSADRTSHLPSQVAKDSTGSSTTANAVKSHLKREVTCVQPMNFLFPTSAGVSILHSTSIWIFFFCSDTKDITLDPFQDPLSAPTPFS